MSGRVVSASGDPIEGICVGVSNGPGATTGADGSYLVEGIEPGRHTILFVDCTATPIYVASWYQGHAQQDQADTVTVVADADVPLADMTLVAGVAVSGVVTDGSGARRWPGSTSTSTPSTGRVRRPAGRRRPTGRYRTGPLPDGSYRVQFSDPNNVWATQYWQSAATFNTATPVQLSVAAGNEHGGVDATLTAGATITGLVTDTAGTPLANICVNANTPEQGGFSGLGSSTQTAADGTYALAGLPGGIDVRVQFHDCSAVPTHVDQWYDGVTDANASTPLVLAAGEVRTGIDGRLPDGIRVAGTVTDTAGNPLAGIDVNVNPDGPGSSGFARTDGDGRYVTSAGAARALSRPVPRRLGVAVVGGDVLAAAAELQQRDAARAHRRGRRRSATGSTVSSRPRRPSAEPSPTSTMRPSATCASTPSSTRPTVRTASARRVTAADGTYTFNGLPSAQVRIRVQDCNVVGPYRTMWWPAADTYDAAGIVDLQAGQHRTGVDVQLTAAATISGTVTDDQQRPLAGVCVQATTPQAFGALAQTDGNGDYQMILNSAGDYTVQFVDCTQQPTHAGVTAPATVPVTLGQRVSGIDATLAAGATSSVTGSIRNGGGVAITGGAPSSTSPTSTPCSGRSTPTAPSP